MALTGNEIIQVLGTDQAGHPAASRFPTTTLSIAQLANNLPGARSTVVVTGTTAVTVTNTNIQRTSIVDISLNTPGGTVGAIPTITTISPGVSFTVTATAGDTSTYNYSIT